MNAPAEKLNPTAPEQAHDESAPSVDKAQDALRRVRIVEHLEARNWFALAAMMERDQGEITDESEAIEDTLAELAEERLELIGEAYLGLMAAADVLKAEEARIKARRQRFEELAEKLPGMVKIDKKVETPLCTFKITTSNKWESFEGEDVPPAEVANEAFRVHVPESYRFDVSALKKASIAADKLAAKLDKKAKRKRNPEEPTEAELAELAAARELQEQARVFGRIVTAKNVKISRTA